MKILLLDDQPDLIRLYKRALEQSGHTVLLAFDGASAWRALKAQGAGFDIAVLDLMLKRYEPEFAKEQAAIDRAAPTLGLPSGQAVGLRLWGDSPRIPYCYLSADTTSWVPVVNTEFDGKQAGDEATLILRKEHTPITGLAAKLEAVVALWNTRGW